MGEVRLEQDGSVLTITLADVEHRNSLNATVLNGLHDGITRANEDDAIRVVVVTNEGSTFCAGANLKERSGAAAAAAPKAEFEDVLAMILQSSTPVIGKIKGHAVGGGNGLAAAMDVSIAVEDAQFGFTEVRLGVAPAIISVVCLPKLRPGDAMELFLRGNRFSGARAAELGLINRAVPADEIDAAVDEVIADLARGGPNALGFCKRLVQEVPAMPRSDAFAWTARQSNALFASEEAAEGMKAFIEKRKAAWVPPEA